MTKAKLAAVVGCPVGHSLSPAIHNTWARREGANAFYIPVETGEDYDAFARAINALTTLGFSGCNVTIPHKESALQYAVRATGRAQRAGAANMLTFGEEGAYADNSDVEGFIRAAETVLTSAAPKGRAVVLGAGGAARGVVLALKEMRYAEIIIANRTHERAQALAADLGDVTVAVWKDRSAALEGADLLVNATALGMSGAPALDIDIDPLPKTAVVADIVYSPLQTPLLRTAGARGLKI
ncbi:MAG: shikimate dehydrogenase family protein, partial [Parvularculaceae bacterium]